MRFLLALCFVGCTFYTSAKEVTISFDDAPRKADGYFNGKQRAQTLIASLNRHNVKAAFFAVSSKLDAEGAKRLQTYANAGHIIANHTHTHPNFNAVGLESYKKDFLLADTHLSKFNGFKKWFRFPYLREGDTRLKRDGMRALLQEKGYFNAYITLNNYDWYMEQLFQEAVEKPEFSMDKMRDFYVSTLMESIEYYDQMAVKHLGRSPKHVLLLHEMDISALFIGDLIKSLKRNGWKLISPELAYKDPIATRLTNNIFKYNPGRVGEIAKDNGQKKGFWHYTLDENYLKTAFENEVMVAKPQSE